VIETSPAEPECGVVMAFDQRNFPEYLRNIGGAEKRLRIGTSIAIG
jgi:hypothetical protein